MEAYVERLARLVRLGPTIGGLADLQMAFPELTALTSDLKELHSYLSENSPFNPMPPGRLGQFLIEQGLSFEQAQDAAVSADWRPPGRPTSARVRAVAALEMKTIQGLSWQQLAIRLCPCGLDHHGHECAQRIRQAVMDLQDRLARYQITFP
jgi:hypothetical protein